jgi:tetratricopeptide (TPR) repeat protein
MTQIKDSFLEAMEAQRAGKLDHAQTLFRQTLQANPNHEQANYQLGALYFQEGDPVSALDYLLQAVALDPASAEAQRDLGRVWNALGQPTEALACFQQAVARKPNSAEMNFYVGCALQAQNRMPEATVYFRRAAELQPGSAEAQNNLGAALAVQGLFQEAVVYFRKALSLNPNYPDAHKNLAAGLRFLGDTAGAAASERKLQMLQSGKGQERNRLSQELQSRKKATLPPRKATVYSPHSVPSLIRRGHALHIEGKWPEAEELYRKVLALQPDNVDVLNRLGSLLMRAGRAEESIKYLQKAIAANPRFASAYNNMGNSYKMLGKSEEAETCFRKAIALEPSNPLAINNLGNMISERNQYEEAIPYFQRAIALQSDYVAPHNNLGIALHVLGRLDESENAFRRAALLDPQYVPVYVNMSNTLRLQGRYEEAEESVRKALELDPKSAEARSTLGMLRLVRGDFPEGWIAYEFRPAVQNQRPCPQPRWTGEALPAGTLLVSVEQGMGDTIQFVRYLPIVKERFQGRVVFECYPEVQQLLKACDGFDALVPWKSSGYPEELAYDRQITLMSVPGVLGTDIETIPAHVPYVPVDPGLSEAWARRLPDSDALKVGIVWAGSADFKNDRNRSCRLADFGPLGQVPNVIFYSLQKGERAEQAASPPEGMVLTDLNESLQDFADTAAAIHHLDLIITVDTSVAHLAGALGRPVWTLLPFSPDWRWMLEREDTPWYPTMRLFRQPRPEDWNSVFTRVAEELRAYCQRAFGPKSAL